jgi:hypothetical protein
VSAHIRAGASEAMQRRQRLAAGVDFVMEWNVHFASRICRARRNTEASISSVNLPVEVFCWLG